jgi:hypothetical protein
MLPKGAFRISPESQLDTKMVLTVHCYACVLTQTTARNTYAEAEEWRSQSAAG